MVQHIVMWNLKPEVDKQATAAKMKQQLEALVGVVPGLVSAQVTTGWDGCDVVLVSTCKDREALAVYQNHPEHVAVKGFIQSVAASRVFCDSDL